MNTRIPSLLLVLLFACAAPLAVRAAEEKPIVGSLSVSPKPGLSKVSSSGGKGIRTNTRGTQSSTKTNTRSLRWQAEVRFREQRPQKTELVVHYLGQDDKNTIIEIGQDKHELTLDENGRATLDLASPTTTMTRTRTVTRRGGRGRFGGGGSMSSKSTQHGERVTGCIVQLFADGKLSKSWTSDSRWSAESKKPDFNIDNLNRKNGRIGL